MAYQLTKAKDGLVLFGYYPQTRKPEDVTISDAPNEYGVCTGSDGQRYLSAFDDFFLIEPIRWRVLRERENKLFLLSERILDYRVFDEASTTSYLWSDLSDRLDDEFFYDAFSLEERKHILQTSIKCDAESATPPEGAVTETAYDADWRGAVDPKDEAVFKDKVFLLSLRNVTTPEFGFDKDPYAGDEARVARKTDYAAAASGAEGEVGAWWLRSPVPGDEDRVRVVSPEGNAAVSVRVGEQMGVRPALRIKL